MDKNSYLGIDIGTASLKLVEMKKSDRGLELVNYGILENTFYLDKFSEPIQASVFKMSDKQITDLIKILLEKVQVNTNKAIASFPIFSSFATLLELPYMSEKQTDQIIESQLKEYFPASPDQVVIEWFQVGVHQDDGGNIFNQIFLVSILKEQIEKYKNIFKDAGLDLIAFELEGMSNARSLTSHDSENNLIIDIGARSTSFFIAQKGKLKFAGQTDFAGASLTQTIAAGLNISLKKAENIKKENGLENFNTNPQLSTLMEPIINVIIDEGKQVKSKFEKDHGGRIDRVILTGGGARLSGLLNYAQEEMKLPVSFANPFSELIYAPEMESLLPELKFKLSIAIGLGLKLYKRLEFKI